MCAWRAVSDFVLRPCDLDEVVRGCLRKYAPLFILKKLPLDFRETGLTVLSDEKWLAFVIEQLLANALKYTRAGHVAVYAEGRALIVEDTGIGIAPEGPCRAFSSAASPATTAARTKVHRPRPLPLLARLPQAGAPAHPRLRARPRHPRPPLLPTGPYPEAPGGGEGQ